MSKKIILHLLMIVGLNVVNYHCNGAQAKTEFEEDFEKLHTKIRTQEPADIYIGERFLAPKAAPLQQLTDIFGLTFLAALPTDVKKLLLEYMLTPGSTTAKATEAGKLLRTLSRTSAEWKDAIDNSEFTDKWLTLVQNWQEAELLATGKSSFLQRDALLYLSTTNALDHFIKTNPALSFSVQRALTAIINERPTRMSTLYTPLAHRALQRKLINPDEIVIDNTESFRPPEPALNRALHANNDPYLIKLLLTAGANPTMAPETILKYNYTASIKPNLQAATENINENTLEAIQLLMRYHADVKNGSGRALSYALQSDSPYSVDILDILLAHGAPVTDEVIAQASRLQQSPELDEITEKKLDKIGSYLARSRL